MTPALWFLACTLATWGAIFAACAATYHLAISFGSSEPGRSEARRTFAKSLGIAAVLAILGTSASRSNSGFSLPVVWPILPFEAWASIACLSVAIGYEVLALVAAGERRRTCHFTALVWTLAAICFFALFRHSGDSATLAEGAIGLTPVSAFSLAILAVVACLSMAASERAVRFSGYARTFAIQAALLAGCIVFGLPFLWLLITSFKEDRDMASSSGLVWIPKTQDTVTTYDAIPPIYETVFEGRTVQVNIVAHNADGTDRVDVLRPEGIQGRMLDRAPSALRRIPASAPVVRGPYRGQIVTGYVIQDFDDGRQKVKITNPTNLAGTIFTGLPRDLEPVRHPGLRWQNYTEALEYLPPEADLGLVYLRNTLLVAVLSVIGTVLSSSVVAYGFSRLRFPGRDLLFGVLLSTMMLPSAVTLLPRFIIFRDLGWIDTLLPLWAPAFFASAFNVFLLRQFFKNLPVELEDAAKIDGCSYLKSYWSVMMPQIKPALAVISIWTFMGAWNDFMGPLVYISSPEKMTVSYAVQMFATDRNTQPGLMMAFAAMSVIPVVLLFFFAQRYFIEGVTLTGFGGK